jgi:hypothetical protein
VARRVATSKITSHFIGLFPQLLDAALYIIVIHGSTPLSNQQLHLKTAEYIASSPSIQPFFGFFELWRFLNGLW